MNDPEDLQQLALRLSAFVDVLGKHASRLVQETSQETQALRATAQTMGVQAQRLSQELVQAVGRQARDVIERNAGEGMRHGSEQLRSAGELARHAADAMQRELAQLRAAQQSLLWKAGTILVIGALLAAGTSGYLAWRNHRAMQQARFSTDILEATRSGALTRCGDMLCARIGAHPARFGANKEYARVD
jgi:hypothetical protein